MNVMKKILPILALTLLVPQVALAAWWNPFSWRVFKRSDVNTQQLESRVKELEKKLEDTNPSAKPSSINQSAPSVKSTNPIQKTESDSSNKDYRTLASLRFNSAAKLVNLQIGMLDTVSEDADIYIQDILTLAQKARAGVSLFPKEADFYNTIADIYTQHQNNISGFQKSVDEYISQLHKYKAELESAAIRAQSQFISLVDVDKLGVSIDAEVKKTEDSVNTVRNTYDNYTDAFLKDNRKILSALELSMSNLRSAMSEINALKSGVSEYRPAVIPQIQMPKTTYCTMSSTYGANYSIVCN